MMTDLRVSSMIIATSIIIGSIIDRTKPEYHYEFHGDSIGFTVQTNKTTGHRCLLNEGAVRVVTNWRDMAKNYNIPLKLCNGSK